MQMLEALTANPFRKEEDAVALDRIPKSRMVKVGDSLIRDLPFAQAIGIDFIGVLTGEVRTPQEWLNVGVVPTHILPSIAALLP
jgi:ribonucleotide monophosphatase NagD (HAD superfamily)